jgi:hypothetical protein
MPCRRQGERKYSSCSILTSALDGVNGLRQALAAFNPRERTPFTHWIGGWVDLRDGLDTAAKGNILCLCLVLLWFSSLYSDTILPELPQLLIMS